jgi:hypothetical protein
MFQSVFWFLFGILVGGVSFFGGTLLVVVMLLKKLNSSSNAAASVGKIATRRIGANLVCLLAQC